MFFEESNSSKVNSFHVPIYVRAIIPDFLVLTDISSDVGVLDIRVEEMES